MRTPALGKVPFPRGPKVCMRRAPAVLSEERLNPTSAGVPPKQEEQVGD